MSPEGRKKIVFTFIGIQLKKAKSIVKIKIIGIFYKIYNNINQQFN